MNRLIWSEGAQHDLRAITRYYEQFAADLPLRLIERVEVAALQLLDFPQIGASLPDSTVRVWRAKRTPYLLFYRHAGNDIRILKVRHALSDWKPRS